MKGGWELLSKILRLSFSTRMSDTMVEERIRYAMQRLGDYYGCIPAPDVDICSGQTSTILFPLLVNSAEVNNF